VITCPQCESQQLLGTIFCTECGTQLAAVDLQGTLTISRNPAGSETGTSPKDAEVSQAENGRLAVHLVDSGIMIPLENRDEFTLGRLTEGQPVVPDVDLSAHRAYENGVSRLHAVVRFHDQALTITDLGSANGTYINGVRVPPNAENRISTGDLITLGKLRLQFVFAPD
jgi:hypothetical protein